MFFKFLHFMIIWLLINKLLILLMSIFKRFHNMGLILCLTSYPSNHFLKSRYSFQYLILRFIIFKVISRIFIPLQFLYNLFKDVSSWILDTLVLNVSIRSISFQNVFIHLKILAILLMRISMPINLALWSHSLISRKLWRFDRNWICFCVDTFYIIGCS